MSERRGRIHEKHDLSKTRRCELLDVPRSSAYYRGESVSEADLAVMRLIDETHLQWPFYGSRRMRDELEERGHTVNRKRVQRRTIPRPERTVTTVSGAARVMVAIRVHGMPG